MTTAEDVLDIARSYLGYAEGQNNQNQFGEWYGMKNQAWCAMFASYCSYRAGLPIPATTEKGYAWCPSGMAYFKRIGRFSTEPSVGAHIYFKFPGEGSGANHVGLVEKILPDGVIQTIEGNTHQGSNPDQVMRRHRKAFILGYGLPPYVEQAKTNTIAAAIPKSLGKPTTKTMLSKPAVSILGTITGNGYWIFAEDGGVFAFGDAAFYGSMGGQALNAPIVGAAIHPTGMGYWLVAADGGIFNFGAAKFFESMGGKPLNAPIKAIFPHPSAEGYWLVGEDGGIFAFGASKFFGSTYDVKVA